MCSGNTAVTQPGQCWSLLPLVSRRMVGRFAHTSGGSCVWPERAHCRWRGSRAERPPTPGAVRRGRGEQEGQAAGRLLLCLDAYAVPLPPPAAPPGSPEPPQFTEVGPRVCLLSGPGRVPFWNSAVTVTGNHTVWWPQTRLRHAVWIHPFFSDETAGLFPVLVVAPRCCGRSRTRVLSDVCLPSWVCPSRGMK